MPSPRKTKAPKPESQSLETVEEFVGVVSLEDINCFEERGRVIRWPDEELQGRELPEFNNAMAVMSRDGGALLRFRVVYSDLEAEYVADWGAEYSWPEEFKVPGAVLREFAERVGFFAVYPFLRASIYGSASRLNKPIPILPIVRQGEFETSDRLPEGAVKTIFGDDQSERITRPADASN